MEKSFYNDNFATQYRDFLKDSHLRPDVSYYKSKYNRQPYGDIHSSLMLLHKGGQIIGCIASLGDKARIREKVVNIRTLADYYVKPEFRGYGINLLLGYVSKFRDDVFLCFPNQVAGPLYEKLGWRNISSVFRRHYFPIDIAYSVMLRRNWRIPTVVNRVFQGVLGFYIWLQKRNSKHGRTYTIHGDLRSFCQDDAIYELWTGRSEGESEFMTSVTPEHFRIYDSEILKTKVVFITICNKEGKASAACIIVFDGKMHAEITEYAGELDALRFLFVLALDVVVQHGGRVLAVTTSRSKHAQLLKGLLFFRGGKVDAYLYSNNPDVRAELNGLHSFCISSGTSDGWL